jgi:hypothetical protein
MPARSSIAKHPDRPRIEHDLARGVPVRQLAKKYGVTTFTLYRFRKKMPPQMRAKHLGARLKAGADLEKLRIDESEGLLQNLAQQRARLLMLQDSSVEVGDRREATFIAGEIHRNLKLVGQYLGEFAQHQIKTNISVLISPEYLELRSKLMRALARSPRRAVLSLPRCTPRLVAGHQVRRRSPAGLVSISGRGRLAPFAYGLTSQLITNKSVSDLELSCAFNADLLPYLLGRSDMGGLHYVASETRFEAKAP